MNILEALDVGRAMRISEAYYRGENISHTVQMVYFAELGPADEKEKKAELLRIISELELAYHSCSEKLLKPFRRIVEEELIISRKEVSEGNYWNAIICVYNLEADMLKNHLERYPNIDSNLRVELALATKVARSMGGDIVCTLNEPEDDRDDAGIDRSGHDPRFRI